MTIDPVKIPQNVYVEDRIIGPVSLRQIMICLLTGGITYMLYASFEAARALTIFTRILAFLPFLIGTAFAFVKVNGITLTRFCLLLIERADKPVIRIWTARKGISISIGAASVKSDEELIKETRLEAEKRRDEEKRKRIEELSSLLDHAPSSSVEREDLIHATQEVAPESSSTLPVERTRISADPLEPSGTHSIREERSTAPVIRDISPPVA